MSSLNFFHRLHSPQFLHTCHNSCESHSLTYQNPQHCILTVSCPSSFLYPLFYRPWRCQLVPTEIYPFIHYTLTVCCPHSCWRHRRRVVSVCILHSCETSDVGENTFNDDQQEQQFLRRDTPCEKTHSMKTNKNNSSRDGTRRADKSQQDATGVTLFNSARQATLTRRSQVQATTVQLESGTELK